MIIEYIMLGPLIAITKLIDFVVSFLHLDVVFNEELIQPFISVLEVVLYLFPVVNMLPLISAIFSILGFKIYMSLMRLILQFLPFF